MADRGPSSSQHRCPMCGDRVDRAGAVCSACSETRPGVPPNRAPEHGTLPDRIAEYRILAELGSGGMGTVYAAHDEKMNRRVALKVLSRHLAPSGKAGARFEKEAWIAGALDHPGIVKVYDKGLWQGCPWFSMELVDGGSLHDVILAMRANGRDPVTGLAFDTSEYTHWALSRIVRAGEALDYAHRRGIVHRDVKPLNLLLAGERRDVKIVDFGLALDADATRMTSEGAVLGTLAYMAPEQLLGNREAIGVATDVYALGVTLFELLTLHLPYRAATQQLYASAVLTAEARRPRRLNRRVGRDLEIVLRKALEKDPRDRYASAAAFADDVDRVLHLRPIAARPTGRARRVWKWMQRKPLQAALAAILAIGLPAISILGVAVWRHAEDARTERAATLLREARTLVSAHQNDDAARVLDELLRLRPDDAAALRLAAVLDFRLVRAAGDDTLAAAEAGARALERIDRILGTNPIAAAPYAFRATVLRALGRPDEARAAMESAERYRTESPSSDELSLDVALAHEQGRYREALVLYGELLERDPGNFGAVLGRGQAYEALGDLERASEDFRFAARLRSDDASARVWLADALARRKREDEAEAELAMAERLAAGSPPVLERISFLSCTWGERNLSRGEPERARGRFERAERAARASIALQPARALSHLNLGVALVGLFRAGAPDGRALLEEALRHYEYSLDTLPDVRVRRKLLRNHCDATLELGDLSRAEDSCRAALEAEPDNEINHYNLAGLHALAGRPEEALDALERDVELGDRDWEYLLQDDWFRSLRSDPRFVDLIARMRDEPHSR